VDISFDGFRGNSAVPHIGLASAAYVNELLRADNRLRSLVLVLKHLLVVNDLNSAYTGGLSSYSVVLWTAAYAASDSSEDLGLVLKGLFRFYGLEFDPKTTTIDLSQSGM
jgi:DNA polymerase sigma